MRNKYKALMKRLDKIEEVMDSTTKCGVLCLGLENYLDIDRTFPGTFIDYLENKLSRREPKVFIIDDSLLMGGGYIPSELIFLCSREGIQKMADASGVEFINGYISIFEKFYLSGAYADNSMFMGLFSDDMEWFFYEDFKRFYKNMSPEELLERYKDKRFFKGMSQV